MPHQKESRLPFREMIAFGCGDFASVLYWQTFMKYLPYFYTEVFGMTAGALATMLLISRIWDGVNDPIVGMLADRTNTRWGKFRPYLLYGAVPFAIFGVLTFTTPSFGVTGKLIWAYLTYNGLMMLYTTVNIPYTALMGVMTSNPVERTRLSSIKFMFAFAAGMVISATLLPLVNALGGAQDPQRGWQITFALVGAVAVVFFLITFFGTRERIRPAVSTSDSSVARDLRQLAANRPWLILLGTSLTWILATALRSSASAHYFKYYIFDGTPDKPLDLFGRNCNFIEALSIFNTCGQAASLLGVVGAAVFLARFPKKTVFILIFIVKILYLGSFYFLKSGQLEIILVLEIIGNFFGAPVPVLMWAMYADIADYGEWKSGRRTTALVFSASTMSQKFGWAFAAFAAFQLLHFVGFQANIAPSDAVKSSLVNLMSIYPFILGAISIIIFLFYPLTDKRMAEINADLAARGLKTDPAPV